MRHSGSTAFPANHRRSAIGDPRSWPSRALRAAATAALALAPVLALEATAQRLPLVEEAGPCRSEMEARLAFGLCEDGTFDFYAGGEYRSDVPRPDEVLGYPIGSWHTTYGHMERYLSALSAAAPERVRVLDYGTSIQRRTQHLVAVSSETNIGRLEQIRTEIARLTDPRSTSPEAAASIAAGSPVIVWLNAANDGNETAAFEAAIQLAYQLAAGEDARTRAMRDGAVVLINLAHNPESHERMAEWYNAFVMGDANPIALEHRAPWGMDTNNNHYQIDLNRDGLGLTQTETRNVVAEMRRWNPQVFVDLHGQTTQMFFPPAAVPVNPAYPPSVVEWLERFGAANAEAFDQHGWSYYVRDVFDLYYPGYFDTYPTLHGATGMTFETDGGGRKGVRWRRDDGTILTFADGIAHHYVASLATVETAVRNSRERLSDFYDFFASGMADARDASPRTVVWIEGNHPDRAGRLATTLLRHGIEVGRTTAAATVTGTDYMTGERASHRVPAGSYVVDLAQPNAILARTLLAPSIELPPEFAQQELAKLARNIRRPAAEAEGYAFYDVTAWSLPLATGVTALHTGGSPSLDAEPLRLPDELLQAPGGWRGEVAWRPRGGTTGRARSAYVWEPGSEAAVRLTARLMDEGYSIVVVHRPMQVGERPFPRGSFVARVGRNPDALHERIDELAREYGLPVYAAQTAFPAVGPTGTGSNPARSLSPPSVAVLAGEGVSITSYGALWFVLERRIEQPFTAIRVSDVGRADLEAFDVIIAPHGSGYGRELGEAGQARLKEWIGGGGTLIAYAGGAGWAIDADLGTSHDTARAEAVDPDTAAAITRAIEEVAPLEDLPPFTSPEARPDDPIAVPGSFLRGRLDPLHWLTFGYAGAELPLLAERLPLAPSRTGANPVVYATDDLVISGFSWPENTVRSYAGRPYATVDAVGRGQVILFAEDPLYRTFFDAPAQLLYNAIFIGARGRRDAAR